MQLLINRVSMILLLLLSLTSCEEEQFAGDTFVVEGYIYAGLPIRGVTVKTTVPFEETEVESTPIDDATVIINYQNQPIELQFNQSTKKYDGPNDITIETGTNLNLDLVVDGESAVSHTVVPPYPENLRSSEEKILIPEIELGRDLREVLTELFQTARLDIIWSNEAENYHFLVIELADTTDTEPIFGDDLPPNIGDFFENFRLVSEPSRDSTYTVIGLSLQNYGQYRAILYRINQEYADLYADQLQDSRNLNEPPTNVENGLGIFTGVSSDTVLFEISKF